MNIHTLQSPDELGQRAASFAAEVLNRVISEQGKARIVLSTGASQFAFLQHFIQQDIPWANLEMFHLDEYVNLSERHPASFRKYLKERFLRHVPVGKVHLINGEGNIEQTVQMLNEEIQKEPIDLALIGIGENAHIAFNDPPADFDCIEPYKVVNLAENCKQQQVGEGWFESVSDVPDQAISMTVHQIMQSKVIVSCVPYKVKSWAIARTLKEEITNEIPSTILKSHANWHLYLDDESASALSC